MAKHLMNWQAIVEKTVTALGYDPVDVERSSGGLLRVYIDIGARTQDAGANTGAITVDDCERVTRQLQYVLEVEGIGYERLEVSSPGLDRPLRRPADWQRFAGSRIELTLRAPLNGRKRFSGVYEPAADGWRLVFSDDGKHEQALDFTLDEVRDARLVPVLDFKRRSARGAAVAEPVAGGSKE
jgi:ribosome maturation factor RimP